MFRVILFTLFGIALCSKASAQIKSFSPDPAIYIKEFEQFIRSAEDKALDADLEIFLSNWKGAKFDAVQQKNISKLCNSMIQRGLNIKPYFSLVLSSLNAFASRKLPAKNLQQWQQIADNLLGRNPAEYLSFLQLANNLFRDNTIFRDPAKRWYAKSMDFDILFTTQIEVRFKKTDLICRTLFDSLIISNTEGTYIPGKNLWKGNGGLTGWERTMPGEQMKVQLFRYETDVLTSGYLADSAWLSYPKFFSKQVLGRFEDRASYASNPDEVKTSSYPKFSTFRSDLEIRNLLGPRATYTGGLTINGAEITTVNAQGKESVITIYFKGKKKIIAKSASFKIADGTASSLESSFLLIADSAKGNIYHQKVQFNFNFKEGKLVVTKGVTGLMRAPFSDDFHKLDIDVQQLRWNIEEPFIDFDMVNKNQDAKIESAGFFKEFRYEKLQGALRYNPLEKMTDYYRTNLSKDRRIKFAVKDYATYLKNSVEHIEAQLIDLADGGYIVYNPFEDSITIRAKLFNYVQSHHKLRDYDVIRFSSLIAARPNGTLNLLTNELKLEGVQRFYFSDSQNVVALPTEQIITVLENRRLKFSGMIRAGRFDFFGKNFEFDYDKFQILYTNIDSMRLYFPDSSGKAIVPIKSVLRNIYGTLYIDKPNNKSGLKSFPEYPIFRSDKGSVITYEKSYIHGGAYKPDKFYFEVDPFTIDSLDNFTISGLAFDGTFRSDGIFPDFREKARIQKDYSLGFISHTPPGGFPMYRGKGKGDMAISLSEQGLYGSGTIEYSGSKTKSNSFLLLPDKMKAQVESYELPQSAKYPEVYAANAGAEWKPGEDKFTITNGEAPIRMFKMGYSFYGSITQSPAQLKGDGVLKWSEANFSSKDMTFGSNKTSAQEAALQIFSLDSTRVAFRTDHVRGTLDFDKGAGDFTNNIPGSPTLFPWNKYATNMSDYRWDIRNKAIEVKTGASMAGITPMFVSTHPNQDSLRFEAKKGIYDLRNELLRVEGIPHIDIADSRMVLKNGKVTVRKDADMDPVDSARITANRKDKFHEIYRSDAKIYGRNKMRAKGYYVYVNKVNYKQELFLDSILVNREKLVEAWGKVEEAKNFTLDTKIAYKGLIKVLSNEKYPLFTGYFKPLHTFKNVLPSAWIRYSDYVDPKKVILKADDPRDKDNKRQYVGLYIANDSSHVYPLFYSWKKRYSDPEITGDTGILYYDDLQSSFFAGNKDKLLQGGLKGNFIQFNEKTHAIHAEGRMDFGFDNSTIKCISAGTADLPEGDSSFNFQLAMFLDFPLPKSFNERLYTLLTEEGAGKGSFSNNDLFVKKAVGELISDDKTARTVMKNMERTGILEGRDEAAWKFCFTKADFRWNSKQRGMACTEELSLANFDGKTVNRDFEAKMLVEHRRSGENMFLYMEISAGNWIYINTQRNVTYVWTSDELLNQSIINEGPKVSTDTYTLRTAAPSMVDRFLRKME